MNESAEVFTHQREVDAMLDMVADAFHDLDVKFLEPSCGSGNFLTEILRRKLALVTKAECVSQEQYEHRLLRALASIYGVDISPENIAEARGRMAHVVLEHYQADANTVEPTIGFLNAAALIIGDNIVVGDTLNAAGDVELCDWQPAPGGCFQRVWSFALVPEADRDLKFDVIVGNPPYQTGDKKNDDDRASPIYQHFIEQALAMEPKYVAMIVPSRWFTGGFGLDKFRERMIADRRFAKIVDNPKLFDCFPGVEIKGGVNYFLWDRDHDGDCEFSTRVDGVITSTLTRDLRDGNGIVMRDNRAAAIVQKVKQHHQGDWCDTVCGPQMAFGSMRTNFSDYRTEPAEGDVPMILGGGVGYVAPEVIEKNKDWVNRWKVLVPMAGDGHGREVSYVIGEPMALAPGSACTQTYLVAGVFSTKTETKNYANYLATKFVRFLILQRKTTQHVYSDRFRFVPKLDMKRAWTDKDLYDHFGLTAEERAYIDQAIHPRDVILSLDSPVPSSHLPGGAKYRRRG
jgi:site-specific DNA-methyltransferase (adenine-specific)